MILKILHCGNDIEENSDLSDLMEETDLAGEPSFMEESVSRMILCYRMKEQYRRGSIMMKCH